MNKLYKISASERALVQVALVAKGGVLLPDGNVQAPSTEYWAARDWAWNGQFPVSQTGAVDTGRVYWNVPDTEDSPQGLTETELAEYVQAITGEYRVP